MPPPRPLNERGAPPRPLDERSAPPSKTPKVATRFRVPNGHLEGEYDGVVAFLDMTPDCMLAFKLLSKPLSRTDVLFYVPNGYVALATRMLNALGFTNSYHTVTTMPNGVSGPQWVQSTVISSKVQEEMTVHFTATAPLKLNRTSAIEAMQTFLESCNTPLLLAFSLPTEMVTDWFANVCHKITIVALGENITTPVDTFRKSWYFDIAPDSEGRRLTLSSASAPKLFDNDALNYFVRRHNAERAMEVAANVRAHRWPLWLRICRAAPPPLLLRLLTGAVSRSFWSRQLVLRAGNTRFE